ncbi:hypothetical protein AGR1C_pTi0163 [Agrobacterium fabacearum TT111]|nr:hypothetical protein AGR1C_pTi0163 [Agrobacterium fabacearum TT111]
MMRSDPTNNLSVLNTNPKIIEANKIFCNFYDSRSILQQACNKILCISK